MRIEHLQAISVFDAAAEGHPRANGVAYPEDVHLDAARDWYMDLWDSLHPNEPWSTDPPVVVLEFEVEHACPAKP